VNAATEITFAVQADSTRIEAAAQLPAGSTYEDAQAIAALFPKSVKVVGTTVSFSDGREPVGCVLFSASITANKTTGEVNEASMRRYNTFLKAAAKLGFVIESK
jgi:hypothetical protein